ARYVLVVDDDPVIRRLVGSILEHDGVRVESSQGAEEALAALARQRPALLVLDIEMPGMSGLELLVRLRDRPDPPPVILLTGRRSETDRVLGLDLGAEDYIVKPFLPREFAARVRRILRRPAPGRQSDAVAAALDFGPLQIRLAEREVVVGGFSVELTAREFDVLAYMAARPRQVVSREDLLSGVWQSSAEWQDPSTVTEHIRRVRKKIEADPEEPRWLVTVRGAGYRFEPGG
ncbi:MAG: response regulator transcription factor, partial [Acidimicrobiales bacterium]